MFKVQIPFYSDGSDWPKGTQFESHRNAAAWLKSGIIIEIKTVKPESKEDGQRKPAIRKKRTKQPDRRPADKPCQQ